MKLRSKCGLAAYAVAGFAAIILGQPGRAAVIHIDPPDILISQPPQANPYWLDLNTDGYFDLGFVLESGYTNSLGFFGRVSAVVYAFIAATYEPEGEDWVAIPLLGDTLIDSHLPRYLWGIFLNTFSVAPGGGPAGLWPNNLDDPRFAGLRLEILDATSVTQLHYGWIRIGTEVDPVGLTLQLKIYDWAYESDPDTPIRTPADASTGTIPEPSTLILVAVGTAAVSILKRRHGRPRCSGHAVAA